MQRIRILVPRGRGLGPDTSVEWYGDLGVGVIDYDRAFPPGRKLLWPEAPEFSGHILGGHLMNNHLDSVETDGHLEGVHLQETHMEATFALVLDSPRYVFGRFRHALRMFNGAGNATGEGAIELIRTVNSSPPVPLGLRRRGWDAETSQLSFEFEPVRFTPVIGN